MSENRKKNQRSQQPMELAYGHVMPQAIEIEKAVLGALMIDKDAYLEVCDLLRPEDTHGVLLAGNDRCAVG